jgi:cellulose synthase/poly-beta-1,6-N-acetylglucosamine synthase-like glycosyltransferase
VDADSPHVDERLADVDPVVDAYLRRRRRRSAGGSTSWLVDVLMFRRMLTPWLVRIGFAFTLLCVLTWLILEYLSILSGSPSPMESLLKLSLDSGAAPSAGAAPTIRINWMIVSRLIGPVYLLIVIRIVLEFCVVQFQISESLTDIRNKSGRSASSVR